MEKNPVGKYIREVRESKNISIAKLAKATGLAKKYLYRVESGVQNPGISTIHKICPILHLNVLETLQMAGYISTSNHELTLGQSLKQARILANLTQEEVMSFCKLSPNYCHRIEAGKIIPSEKTTKMLSDYLADYLDLLGIDLLSKAGYVTGDITLGNKIAMERQTREMSQKEFADVCKIRKETIYSLENGLHKPQLRTLMAIANYLDLNIIELRQLPLK